jgi:hypothetical protein
VRVIQFFMLPRNAFEPGVELHLNRRHALENSREESTI